MRRLGPFDRNDLAELGDLLSLADRVVPMRDVHKGDTGEKVIGLRHDVDDNPGSLDTAMRMAEWEFERGWSSTYFLLHGSYYWGEDMLIVAERIEELGHEIGIHNNAIAEALRTNRDPHWILCEALHELRTAVTVRGTVAHGDPLCWQGAGQLRFVNDELFTESRRPECGDPDRYVKWGSSAVKLDPIARDVYGLEYDAAWLPRKQYLSDSGHQWSRPFAQVVREFGQGQLHMLVHPDWWSGAFEAVTV